MLRVDEIVAFVAEHYPPAARTDETLARFGLAKMAKRRAGTLSKGESRRSALALAFAGNPELVVLDEPTTGLDVESRRRLWEAVRNLGERPLDALHHALSRRGAGASRRASSCIDRGRLLFDGDPQALRERVGGRRLTYVGKDGPVTVTASDADEYVRAMVLDGIPFSDLEISRPSLEEAFLSLTGEGTS